MKWQILLKMPSYSVETQKMILLLLWHCTIMFTTMMKKISTLFDVTGIRIMCQQFERYKKYVVHVGALDTSILEASGPDMDEIRDQLGTAIALGW